MRYPYNFPQNWGHVWLENFVDRHGLKGLFVRTQASPHNETLFWGFGYTDSRYDETPVYLKVIIELV